MPKQRKKFKTKGYKPTFDVVVDITFKENNGTEDRIKNIKIPDLIRVIKRKWY